MKESNAQKIRLGFFVILTGLILITALYLIGKKQNIFGNTFVLSAVFNNVGGLKLGNNVRYSGINVGTVKKIVMINDTTICVGMVVREEILEHIKSNAMASISSDGLVGSMVVNIVPGIINADGLIPGDTIHSYEKISTKDMLNTLSKTNQNAAQLTIELLEITTSINEGKGAFGLLINDQQMGSDLKSTISNLKVASRDASVTMGELKKTIASLNNEDNLIHVFLNDSISANQIKSMLSNLEKSSHEINEVVANLNIVVTDIKNGKGALNLLTKDTILVDDIDEIVKNIKQASVLLNEDLKALQSNTFFKGYFKKLEKEKLKEEKRNSKNLE